MPPSPPRKNQTRSRNHSQRRSLRRSRTRSPSPRHTTRRHTPHRTRRTWLDTLWDWLPFEKEKAVYPGTPRRTQPRRNLSHYRRKERTQRRHLN